MNAEFGEQEGEEEDPQEHHEEEQEELENEQCGICNSAHEPLLTLHGGTFAVPYIYGYMDHDSDADTGHR